MTAQERLRQQQEEEQRALRQQEREQQEQARIAREDRPQGDPVSKDEFFNIDEAIARKKLGEGTPEDRELLRSFLDRKEAKSERAGALMRMLEEKRAGKSINQRKDDIRALGIRSDEGAQDPRRGQAGELSQDPRREVQDDTTYRSPVERVEQDPLEVTASPADDAATVTGTPSAGVDMPSILREEGRIMGDMSAQQSQAIDRELEREQEKMQRIEEGRATAKEQADYWNQKTAELEEKVENQKLTDPDIWGSASTGGKIMLGLGAVLSSFSPSSAQAFRKTIDNAVQRDIDRQKAMFQRDRDALARSNSMYAQFMKLYQNADLAEQATMTMTNSLLARNLERIQVNNAGKLAALNAEKMIGQLEIDGQKSAMELQMKMQDQALKQYKQRLDIEAAELSAQDAVIDSGWVKGRIGDPTLRSKAIDEVKSVNLVQHGLDRLRDIYDSGSFSTRKSDAEGARKQMSGALANLYQLSPRQAADLEKVLPNVSTIGNFKEFFKSDVESLENALAGIKYSFADAYNLNLTDDMVREEESFREEK